MLLIILFSLIQIAPVKLNPWDSIFGWLGKKMNGKTEKRLENVEKQIRDMWINDHRQRILTFARECRDKIINGDVRLFAGVLHDKSGAVKGVIPERYSIYRDGVLDEVDHTGCTRHDNMDASNDQEEDFRVGRMEIDIEEVGRWFFESCQQSVIPIPKSENIIFQK